MTAMTFSHDDIRDGLVDYLYGELDADRLAAFRAHLDACAACRAEVTGAERARTVARKVVRRPLGDAVPERVRAGALEAARAALAARPAVGPAQLKGAAAAPASVTGDGWFSRLRRRWTWTFPTFATVAAMAAFLLVRATIFREAKSPVSEERTRELAKPAAAPPSAPGSPAPTPDDVSDGVKTGEKRGPALHNAAEAPADEAAGAPSGAGRVAAPSAGSEPTVSRPHMRRRRAPAADGSSEGSPSALDGLSSSASSRGAGARLAQPTPAAAPPRFKDPAKADVPRDEEFDRAIDQARARGGMEKDLDEARGESAKASAERESVKAEASQRAPAAPKRAFAVPPPPPAAASAPAPAAAPAAKGEASATFAGQDDQLGSAQAKTSKKSGESREKPSGKKSKTDKQSETEATKLDDEPLSKLTARGDRAAGAPDLALARASQAERLINQRRWAPAITILRDLMRRYPSHPAVPRWRTLLDTAQRGLDTPAPTPPPPR